MKLIITSHNLGLWAADFILRRQQQAAKPFVLGLPTGSTVEEMYAALVSLVQHGKMSFRNITTFNMDEYVGLPPTHAQSYAYYMRTRLFDHIDICPENIHLLDGLAADLTAQCNQYEAAISQAGGIDLFLGGVGQNGHIAFNEPGSSFTSRTRPVELTESTRRANSRFFQDMAEVPTHALTVGISTVLDARELLFLAAGENKAPAVACVAQGEITEAWPITALKTHPQATLLIDPAAASALPAEVLNAWHAWHKQQPQQDFILTL